KESRLTKSEKKEENKKVQSGKRKIVDWKGKEVKEEIIATPSRKKTRNPIVNISQSAKETSGKKNQEEKLIVSSLRSRSAARLKKEGKDKDSANESTEDEESYESDPEMEEDMVDPKQEYSEKYYSLLKNDLMERIDEEGADLIVRVEKRLHEKKLTLENRVDTIVLGGRFEMKTWFDGAYPEEYTKCKKLWVCDGCYKYFSAADRWKTHARTCENIFHPPGEEVYRDLKSSQGIISVWKIDGFEYGEYCKRLSQLAMFFLKDKCVFIDLFDFDFFVVTEFIDKRGFRPVGYFSRQRSEDQEYNLSCFCVFPCYARKGFGRFIIDFSYHLSRLSKMPGTPERPFSPFGRISYYGYWKRTVVLALATAKEFDLKDLGMKLGMNEKDIQEVIEHLFGVVVNKKLELHISETLLESLIAKEEERDKNKLYAKEECFSPNFKAYMKAYKQYIEVLKVVAKDRRQAVKDKKK
ncbi:hypothetical protein PMAYCL1PPCAC_02651, partial [Pristionchus mayeri]